MNNIVSITNGQTVTTSLAIADGVAKDHKQIIRLIRDSLHDLEDFGRVRFENAPFKTSGGTQNREYALLNEQQATLLMTFMRNNDVVREFKKRLVRAFFEMRDQLVNPAVPQNFTEALRLAADQQEKIQEQQAKIQTDAPKVAFHDQVVAGEDLFSVREAAKLLGTGQNRLMSMLRRIGWVTKKNEPYQLKIIAGVMDVKLNVYNHPEHGRSTRATPLVTGKGLTELKKLREEQAA